VPTTPALAPLVLRGSTHAELAGVSHPVALTLRAAEKTLVRLEGPLLWTHFGASGPAVLNLSRHWHRATGAIDVRVSVLPGESFESLERWLLDEAARRPRAQVVTVLAQRLPQAVAGAWVGLARIDRRRLAHAVLATPLEVEDSRGYGYAEVTAGGVPLDEIDTATMESRRQRGLFFTGEILDVDGRLGGFNFQWAWSSGWVAGHALARALEAGR
jgi:predicted Rossmann fold flavoprotein